MTKFCKILFFAGSILGSAIMISNSANASSYSNADDRFFYIGVDTGISEPIVKNFKHKETNTKMRLKQSRMYAARIGYSFYPNMMVEFSYTRQPKYKVKYVIPRIDFLLGGVLDVFTPEKPDITTFSDDVYLLNLVYQFDEQFGGIRPYVVAGAGISKISIKANNSNVDLINKATGVPEAQNAEAFRVHKNNVNCFTWQVGLGVSKEITDNVSLDLGAKMQVVNDIKIKYARLNPNNSKFEDQDPIKKTISVGEFTVGLTFKLPI